MQDLIALVLHLVGLYLAVAAMAIGFAIMVGGPTWAASTARFLLLRPSAAVGNGLAMVVANTATRLGQLVAWLGNAFITYLVDPLVILIGKALRTIFFPRR